MAQLDFYKLREFSAIIAQADDRPEDKVFLQLKGLAGRGLLDPLKGLYGPKGALLFAEDELYRAAVLLAAVDMGIEAENMAKLNAHMRDGFGEALASVKGGRPELWVLEVVRIVEFGTGNPEIYVNWIRGGVRQGSLAVDPLSPDAESLGRIRGVWLIPASVLIAPLWAEMQKAEG